MKAKYALRALCALTDSRVGRLPARAIATQASVPEKFLEAILVDLRNAGFVDSRRGLLGGHALARSAQSIMVGDIIRAIDGPIAPLRCASLSAYKPCDDCADPERCALRDLMADVRVAMSEILDRRSLAQFALHAAVGNESLID